MSKINIMVMDQDDLGIYEIVIENDVGYEKRAVNLVPKGEPSPPHIISITYVTKSSALITWTRGFHGGFDQTVKVETSRDGTSWTPTLSLPQGTLEDTSPVNTTIDELLPASLYYLRMFSVNAGGESSKTRLFEFTTKDILTSNHAAVIGGVVGGSLGVVVAVIVIVIILRRKYTLNCSLSKKKDVHSGIIGQGGDNPGYNAAVTYEVVSSRKDTPDYDALQTRIRMCTCRWRTPILSHMLIMSMLTERIPCTRTQR
ncbi:uncharacterized protein LOC128219529 isoform X3 [Mya arenaria]|uniref:uncharacterized protein LOC128219529 isoform X3 n=1 Tax=Mya arenaria TaxID=6604 RepID=UPI0022E5BB0C|nr:uncharacterized protein LOC128219529 isoform X3 [Mya arenaria]